jgi:hypothetical protein
MTTKIADHVKITGKLHTPSYLFEVDGEDFPWFITEQGVLGVTQLLDNLFAVKVEIVCIAKDPKTKKPSESWDMEVRTGGYNGRRLFLDDVEFPWVIAEDGIMVKSGRTIAHTAILSFLARDVDCSGFVEDARVVCDIDGSTYSMPENSKGWHQARPANTERT